MTEAVPSRQAVGKGEQAGEDVLRKSVGRMSQVEMHPLAHQRDARRRGYPADGPAKRSKDLKIVR